MSNQFGFLSESCFAEKLDTTNRFLASLVEAQGGSFKPDSWKTTQALVRAGIIDKAVGVRDRFVSERLTALATTVGNSEGQTPDITVVNVIRDTFINAMGGTVHKGEYEFVYNGAEWHYNNEPVLLSDYGIHITGTPVRGDEVIVHETAATLDWDVWDKDHDTPSDSQYTHSMTLGMHYLWGITMQFDAPEALFAFPEGLAAGTYYFTVGEQPWYAGDVNKLIGIYVPTDIPAGGQIRANNTYNATMIGATFQIFKSPDDAYPTLVTTFESDGSETSLGTVTRTRHDNINSIDCNYFGCNSVKESALRQWLNSDKAAGNVWTPQNIWDRPPSWKDSVDGFMYGMDADFLAAVGKTHIKVARANTYLGGKNYEEFDDFFFLASRSKQYAGVEVSGVDEGSPYAYFEDYSDLANAGTGADKNRIKYKNGTATWYWEYTPNTGGGNRVRGIGATGVLSDYYAGSAGGVLPACNII